jgi:hypothetical protein
MSKLYINPPVNLLDDIIKRIHEEERLLVLKRFSLFSTFFIISVISILPSTKMLIADFNQSGFFYFFSLIFTDFPVIALYWKNFTIILLETLPAISLSLVLFFVFIFLQSIKFLAKDIKIILKTVN